MEGPVSTATSGAGDPAATAAPAGTSGVAASGDQIRLELAPSGNEARYLVREQLATFNFPSDAVGVTSDVSGGLLLNADGTIVSDESRIVVDLTSLKSDSGRRDNFVRSNVLETNTYGTAEFVPSAALGLPSPLPTSGEVTFQLTGDLTVRGTTRPTTWEVTANVVGGRELTGTATTSFTFAEFGLTQPRVPVVLSVEDNIRLELDFHFIQSG